MSLTAHIESYNKPAVITDTYGSMTLYAKVYAAIYDAVTGQPANGDYAAVTYKFINEDNTTSFITTEPIPGMKLLIWDGEIGHVTFNSKHNVVSAASKAFAFHSLTAGTGTPPPVPAYSDLEITSIHVDNPETSPGTRDAQITINAKASQYPIGYNIDGILSQVSPVFAGLASGNHTVTITDSAGNTVSKQVFIPTVNNLLQSDPSVTLPGGNISRWNAAFNPVVFTYQRKDFIVTDLQLHTVNGLTLVFTNTDLGAVIPGDMVYIETPTCTGTFKVMEKYFSNDVANAMVIDTPFPGYSTGFININRLRPYYKVTTRITFYDKITGRESTITSTNRPNNKGVTRADISNFLQSLLRARDESDYALTNYRDLNLSASYKIAYAEEWDGHTAVNNTIEQPYYVLYAAKQLGERYGGNLATYVPFALLPTGAEKAGWITDFAEPAYSNGYPFDIGFIYGDELTGRNLFAEFTPLDINRNPLPGGPQTGYLLNDDGGWLLNRDGGKLVIARQSQSMVPVPAQLGLNRLLINTNFANDVYYINVALKYRDGDTTHTVTKTQTIRIDDAVDDQSVYLRWIGLSGSWNYYRFVYNQEVSLDVQNAVIIKNYVSDWEHQDSIEEVISKTAGQKIRVMAEDLGVADIKGLQAIKYSPKVQMLVNKNSVKWQTIVINTATYSEYETRNGQAPFSLTFNLPAINIQVQ
ncbi:hypothetical protein NAF17_11485 [Mucilaginibacter sp. RB4R14]|uniref:hypothetical protein n=1 Tax=Mucilaginibacter aurantiaciroseus TaxID=2949308 RepID=UPI002090A001|nr:hypothetical protein [Mucilaginibacter aurantiaciroseus]MCO5936159.1 hypothetical protein [Mucilaginibacter aurantiaciroseus]